MITIYLKQSYNLLKENRFVNGISVAGPLCRWQQ